MEIGIVAPAFIIIYVSMFLKVSHIVFLFTTPNWQARSMPGLSKELRIDMRLAIMGAVLSTIYVLLVVVGVLWFFGLQGYLLVFFYLSATDLFTTSNAWLLLYFSGKFIVGVIKQLKIFEQKACVVNLSTL